MQGERVWFGRDIVLVDRDVFRERPDPQVAGTGVDLIAHLEVAYGGILGALVTLVVFQVAQ